MRSLSVSGEVDDPLVDVVGTSVHRDTFPRSSSYLACCCEVRGGRGIGTADSRGRAKGFLIMPSAAETGRCKSSVGSGGVSVMLRGIPVPQRFKLSIVVVIVEIVASGIARKSWLGYISPAQ